MIKRSGDNTTSTEHNVSGSDPPNKLNSISSNRVSGVQNAKDSSLALSKEDFLVSESTQSTTWLTCGINSGYNSLISGTLQAQISQVKGFDAESPKVLVVDDHSASRMTAAALLGMEGYAVIEADSGATAIKLVGQQQPDLILLDVMMPEMDGFEVCQLLKQDEHTRLIPVIFITALK